MSWTPWGRGAEDWLHRRVVVHLGPSGRGGYATAVVADADRLHELPPGLDAAVAVAAIGTGRTALGLLDQISLGAGRHGPGHVGRRRPRPALPAARPERQRHERRPRRRPGQGTDRPRSRCLPRGRLPRSGVAASGSRGRGGRDSAARRRRWRGRRGRRRTVGAWWSGAVVRLVVGPTGHLARPRRRRLATRPKPARSSGRPALTRGGRPGSRCGRHPRPGGGGALPPGGRRRRPPRPRGAADARQGRPRAGGPGQA